MKARSFAFAATTALVFGTCVSPALAEQTPEQRAAALVAQMTLEEKAGQLLNSVPAIPRLGLPDYQWWSEALHGYAFEPRATNYPEPIGLAASFNAPLVKQIAEAIAVEGRAASDAKVAAGTPLELGAGRTYWSPNLNIFRDPRWGRGQETYGEDPFLTARMGVAYVTGLQGPDLGAPIIIATPKHFAVHSGPESTRHTANVTISLHDMRDTYLPAFRAAVVDGHAGSVMCAYSAVNGQPACANTFLMQDTLRKDWGFKGVVVSDCGAVRDIATAHKYAPDEVMGSALAIRAGLDVECATESLFDRNSFGQSRHYVNAVKAGKLPIADLDQAVTRGLTARIRLGLVGAPAIAPAASNNTPTARQALALAAAEQTLVLLKNDGVLPLDRKGVKIAVVGPLADSRRVLRGNYTMRDTAELPSVLDGLKAAMPSAAITYVPAGASISDGNVVPPSALQTEDGKPGVLVRYYPLKADGKAAPTSLMEKFMRAMTGTVADTPTTTRVEPLVNSEIFTQPLLPEGGKVVASGFIVPPVSGTYRVGGRTIVGSFQFGDKPVVPIRNGFNPAGRLPVTFYRDTTQLPPIEDYAMQGRTYRYFSGKPVYPFGYGLSYTRFAYGPLHIVWQGKGGGITVETEVTNAGTCSGDEVAQVYLDFPKAPGVPKIALRGFSRVSLAPGATRKLRFELSPRDLGSVTPDGAIRVVAGQYRLFVGGGQPDSGLPGSSGHFAIKAAIALPN